jgi:hypothetical protein
MDEMSERLFSKRDSCNIVEALITNGKAEDIRVRRLR